MSSDKEVFIQEINVDPDHVSTGDFARLVTGTEAGVDLAAAIQAKFQLMLQANYIDNLPAKVKARIEYLKELQVQHDGLEEEYHKELEALNTKYQRLYDPLYSKRAGVVSGSDEAPTAAAVEGEAPNGIPDFWLNVLRAEETTGLMITEKDEPILSHLIDISAEDLQEENGLTGYRLHFKFAKNPFFDEEVLTKSYYVREDDDGEMELERAEGTNISWKGGKNPTVKIMKKKPKPGKAARPGRVITKEEPTSSFFNFFSPPVLPEAEDEDDEEFEELREALEDDLSVGELIRHNLIPKAVRYYTGEIVADDEDVDEEDEYGEDDDEDDEDEDEDDDDDDDEEGRPARSGRKKGGEV
eukprot:jgi/Botrbrau1/9974/Bobra.0012s0068.2